MPRFRFNSPHMHKRPHIQLWRPSHANNGQEEDACTPRVTLPEPIVSSFGSVNMITCPALALPARSFLQSAQPVTAVEPILTRRLLRRTAPERDCTRSGVKDLRISLRSLADTRGPAAR